MLMNMLTISSIVAGVEFLFMVICLPEVRRAFKNRLDVCQLSFPNSKVKRVAMRTALYLVSYPLGLASSFFLSPMYVVMFTAAIVFYAFPKGRMVYTANADMAEALHAGFQTL